MDYRNEDTKMGSTMCLGGMMLSRQSTIGSSSRIYYRNPEGVPFKWEEEPGKPLEPQPSNTLPPLSPPPAFLSLGLPKPSIQVDNEESSATKPSVVWLWKQIKRKVKKGKNINKAIMEVFQKGKKASPRDNVSTGSISDRVEKVVQVVGDVDGSYLWKFDGEMMRLTPRSSISSSLSSSNSLSSSYSHTSPTPSLEASKYNHHSFTCYPRNLGEIMFSLVKRA